MCFTSEKQSSWYLVLADFPQGRYEVEEIKIKIMIKRAEEGVYRLFTDILPFKGAGCRLCGR